MREKGDSQLQKKDREGKGRGGRKTWGSGERGEKGMVKDKGFLLF